MAIASGELPQPTQGPKYDAATIDAVFQEVTFEAFTALDQILSRGTTLLHGIEEVFDKQAAVSPDFAPLKRVLQQATSALRPRIEALQQAMADLAAEQAAQAADAATGDAPTPSRRAITGEISSREDVLKLIDKICAYYARYEPSSPLPLLLKRCRRLVPMSFKEIVGDLAPDALAKVELITGKSDD
jgi:type VI secretion system protein ImpA